MFDRLLHDLVVSIPGAIGALFLDFEGEAVQMVGHRPFEADDHDLKVMGAYQGIFLTRLREVCMKTGSGNPDRFKVEFDRAKVLSCDLKDGYYLVLLADATANEGLAWQQLARCRELLMREI
jgi:predicted regulator of Ras-like GTPase activity (Roadblock/LC7/MglB family)